MVSVRMKGAGDENKNDSFSAILEIRVGRLFCFFPLTLELAFFTEETWSALAT